MGSMFDYVIVDRIVRMDITKDGWTVLTQTMLTALLIATLQWMKDPKNRDGVLTRLTQFWRRESIPFVPKFTRTLAFTMSIGEDGRFFFNATNLESYGNNEHQLKTILYALREYHRGVDDGFIIHDDSSTNFLTLPMYNRTIDLEDGLTVTLHTQAAAKPQSHRGGNADGNGDDGKNAEKESLSLSSLHCCFESTRSVEQIESFFQKVLDEYAAKRKADKEALEQRRFHMRFFYDPTRIVDDVTERDHRGYVSLLDNEMTFDSVFFPQKEKLLRVIDDFENRRGRYAIKGTNKKLGILLHGIPGSGKTKTIKALAELTKRHILNVPLRNIETNAQLRALFFAWGISVTGSGDICDSSIRRSFHTLQMDKIIFVLEELDCLIDRIKKRELDRKSRELRRKGAVSPPHNPDKDKDEPQGSSAAPNPEYTRPDLLDLSGLLTVLDGCEDCSGRIVVATSNVIDSLDGALLRPGRFDLCIEFERVTAEDTARMLAHYFPDESVADTVRPSQLPHKKLTGAEIECICAQNDTLQEVIIELQVAADARDRQKATGEEFLPLPMSVPASPAAATDSHSVNVESLEPVERSKENETCLEEKNESDQDNESRSDEGSDWTTASA